MLLLISVTSYAQDIHFSQYNEAPQLLNPGATGVYNGYVRAIINYKNQWTAMGNAFNTSAASIDFPLGKKENKAHIGAGINFFSDKAGDAKIGLTEGALCLSGILPINRLNTLSMGISIGAAQHKANYGALQWGNQYDGLGFNTQITSNEPIPATSFTYVDLSAGLYYEYYSGKNTMELNEQKRLAIGFAYYHMNRPEQTDYTVTEKLYGKFVGCINGHFDVNGSKFSVLPTFACFVQGSNNEYNLGCLVRYRIKNPTKVTGFFTESGISLGASYRFRDAFIPQVNYEIGNFNVGVSYDITTSSYSAASRHNGGAEIHLKYIILRGAKWTER